MEGHKKGKVESSHPGKITVKKNKVSPHSLGRQGEEAAVRYLKKKHYQIRERGFRLSRGEIDIIASHKKTLVFVEVKTRRDSSFGYPEESVTPQKIKQIKKIAQGYLTVNKLYHMECRFDVISLLYDPPNGFSIRHFKNAF